MHARAPRPRPLSFPSQHNTLHRHHVRDPRLDVHSSRFKRILRHSRERHGLVKQILQFFLLFNISSGTAPPKAHREVQRFEAAGPQATGAEAWEPGSACLRRALPLSPSSAATSRMFRLRSSRSRTAERRRCRRGPAFLPRRREAGDLPRLLRTVPTATGRQPFQLQRRLERLETARSAARAPRGGTETAEGRLEGAPPTITFLSRGRRCGGRKGS